MSYTEPEEYLDLMKIFRAESAGKHKLAYRLRASGLKLYLVMYGYTMSNDDCLRAARTLKHLKELGETE
jgi:hypothetical protein